MLLFTERCEEADLGALRTLAARLPNPGRGKRHSTSSARDAHDIIAQITLAPCVLPLARGLWKPGGLERHDFVLQNVTASRHPEFPIHNAFRARQTEPPPRSGHKMASSDTSHRSPPATKTGVRAWSFEISP